LTRLGYRPTTLVPMASRAAQTSRDVRLHVVACQAQHLAGEVYGLLPLDDADDADGTLPEPHGLASSVLAARRALQTPAIQPLPEPLGASLTWLLLLAEAVAS